MIIAIPCFLPSEKIASEIRRAKSDKEAGEILDSYLELNEEVKNGFPSSRRIKNLVDDIEKKQEPNGTKKELLQIKNFFM